MEYLIITYVAFLALIFGSFFNVVGIRIPKKESLLTRSHCMTCDRTLNAVDLIPVFGFIIRRGRCKTCKSKISIVYPIIEGLTAILFVFFYVKNMNNMLEYLVIVLFISMMIIVTVSDIHYKIVPDIILIIFIPLIFIMRIVVPINMWYDGIIGGVLGFGFMYLIALYGKLRFKQDALGGGDIKLYFGIGLFLGYQTVFYSLLFASLIGIVYSLLFKQKGDYIPFVPFIFAGCLLAYMYGPGIMNWYISLF